jgi:hypothetical protein
MSGKIRALCSRLVPPSYDAVASHLSLTDNCEQLAQEEQDLATLGTRRCPELMDHPNGVNLPEREVLKGRIMSEASAPKTWWEAISAHVVWGALVFTCFLVFIEKLLERDFGTALAALLLGLGIAAVALHSRTWLDRTNPNWVYAASVAAIFALILSPFVEEKRWPFSAWFSQPTQSARLPSADDIAAAVVKALPKQALPTTDEIESAAAPIRAERDQALASLANAKGDVAQLAKQLDGPPYVNTIHDDMVKWKLVRNIRSSILVGNVSQDCHVIIVRLQQP